MFIKLFLEKDSLCLSGISGLSQAQNNVTLLKEHFKIILIDAEEEFSIQKKIIRYSCPIFDTLNIAKSKEGICMRLENKKVIALVEEEFEDLELWYPVLRLREEGATVHLVAKEAKKKYTGKYGVPAESDYDFSEINPEEYDGILVPGGWAPDKLRRYDEVLKMIHHMNEAKKPIGQICHAGWVLISAGILRGKSVTSTPGIKDDMMNAGGIWKDEAVVTDGHIISSRRPPDLPPYVKAFADYLAKQ